MMMMLLSMHVGNTLVTPRYRGVRHLIIISPPPPFPSFINVANQNAIMLFSCPLDNHGKCNGVFAMWRLYSDDRKKAKHP